MYVYESQCNHQCLLSYLCYCVSHAHSLTCSFVGYILQLCSESMASESYICGCVTAWQAQNRKQRKYSSWEMTCTGVIICSMGSHNIRECFLYILILHVPLITDWARAVESALQHMSHYGYAERVAYGQWRWRAPSRTAVSKYVSEWSPYTRESNLVYTRLHMWLSDSDLQILPLLPFLTSDRLCGNFFSFLSLIPFLQCSVWALPKIISLEKLNLQFVRVLRRSDLNSNVR